MCDIADGYNDITRHEKRRANKEHVCCGCEETIRKGDHYHVTACLYDGHWSAWKHCLRCNRMFGELHSILSEYDEPVAIDPGLACGALWDKEFGPPPEHVAAPAFWIPGDPLPTEATP